MKKAASVLVFLSCLFIMTAALAAPGGEAKVSQKKVVIIPFINSTEETKEYIGQTINEKIKEQFSGDKYEIISDAIVQPILVVNGYDATNNELADNTLMMNLAKETDADYVIAMEILHFINSRHASFFSTSAKSEVKLRYKVFSKSNNKVTTFQVVGKGNNKVTSIGVPGIGTAMKRGIDEAMNEAFVKIETL